MARKRKKKSLSTVDNRGGWFSIQEPFSGAWQRNIEIDRDCVLKNPIVFTCISGIASDVSKMPVSLERETNKIWVRTDYSREAPVIKKPNLYQNWIQFLEYWIISKTSHGNTYALKERNREGKVTKLYILDPRRVTPLVADDGSVYYQLGADNLSQIGTSVTAPASEIIHDRYNCLFHPLVGISPLFASSIVAYQSNNIHDNSTVFFGNMSRPSGILTAPGAISNENADRLKNHWQTNYSGNNLGKVAVLGDDLKYQPITVSASDSQLIEQLKYSGEVICACFHYPAYKAGLGQLPSYNNIAALNQEYFSGCLQPYVESIESLLKEGLELIDTLRVNLDENVLIRMDKATQIDMYSKATSSLYKIDEARERLNLPPINGGDDIYMQQQNHSLTALYDRDNSTVSESGDVQAEALNGAQVTSLQGLIVAASNGEIPKETVREVILAAFPLISEDRVDQMLSPILNASSQEEQGKEDKFYDIAASIFKEMLDLENNKLADNLDNIDVAALVAKSLLEENDGKVYKNA